MKKLLLLLIGMLLINLSFASFQSHAPAHSQKAQTITIAQKSITPQLVHKLLPIKDKTTIGRYALIGILLFILGALIYLVPELTKLIAATLIIVGIVLFVLDIIGLL